MLRAAKIFESKFCSRSSLRSHFSARGRTCLLREGTGTEPSRRVCSNDDPRARRARVGDRFAAAAAAAFEVVHGLSGRARNGVGKGRSREVRDRMQERREALRS
jgi:hypothetical protein